MSQVELVCKEADFHFNKKHLTDPTVPMWVIRAKGESYYVDHVESTLPWSTKEAPDNTHTKGSIKFKECLINSMPNGDVLMAWSTMQGWQTLLSDQINSMRNDSSA